jgi:hypothetical protein
MIRIERMQHAEAEGQHQYGKTAMRIHLRTTPVKDLPLKTIHLFMTKFCYEIPPE